MTTRTDPPPWPLLALAVVALALVLVTSAVVVAEWAGRAGDPAVAGSAGSTGSTGQVTGAQVVRGGVHDAAVLEVRGDWALRPRGTSLFFTDAEGRISAALDGAAVFRDGACGAGEGSASANRAITGFGRPSRLPARRASRAVVRQWRDAVAHDSRTGTTHATGPLRTRALALVDGSPAMRSDTTVTIREPRACEAGRVRVSVVSLDTGRWTSSVVLVRDLDEPDALGDDAADRLLAGLRPLRDRPG